MSFRKFCLTVGVLLSLAGVVWAQDDLPRFEPFDCDYPGHTVECGYLVVREDRNNPDSPAIRLPVAIIKTNTPNPQPDPVIYLAGGPGGSGLAGIRFWLNAPFLKDRDLILYDQRGTGGAEPSLQCPEIGEVFYDLLEKYASSEEESRLYVDAYLRCRDRLVSEGVNLAAYTSAASAADLDDLRRVLGYEQWNLYGISYGTRLALTTMRDYPDGIRSVILDSVVPLQANLFTEYLDNLTSAFDVLFDACAADADCNQAYPDLKNIFYGLVSRLNEKPVTVAIEHPYTGKNYAMVLHGDVLVDMLFNWLYTKAMIPLLPGLIYEMHNGDFRRAAQLGFNDLITFEFVSLGMYFSVECSEEVSFTTLGEFDSEFQQYPQFRSYAARSSYLGQALLTVCDGWGAPSPAPTENKPVTSDIPALVLSGEFDPVTPPTWGQLAASTLSRSFAYTFPGVGHGATRSDACPLRMALAFIEDPLTEPDSSCIAGMREPAFELP